MTLGDIWEGEVCAAQRATCAVAEVLGDVFWRHHWVSKDCLIRGPWRDCSFIFAIGRAPALLLVPLALPDLSLLCRISFFTPALYSASRERARNLGGLFGSAARAWGVSTVVVGHCGVDRFEGRFAPPWEWMRLPLTLHQCCSLS